MKHTVRGLLAAALLGTASHAFEPLHYLPDSVWRLCQVLDEAQKNRIDFQKNFINEKTNQENLEIEQRLEKQVESALAKMGFLQECKTFLNIAARKKKCQSLSGTEQVSCVRDSNEDYIQYLKEINNKYGIVKTHFLITGEGYDLQRNNPQSRHNNDTLNHSHGQEEWVQPKETAWAKGYKHLLEGKAGDLCSTLDDLGDRYQDANEDEQEEILRNIDDVSDRLSSMGSLGPCKHFIKIKHKRHLCEELVPEKKEDCIEKADSMYANYVQNLKKIDQNQGPEAGIWTFQNVLYGVGVALTTTAVIWGVKKAWQWYTRAPGRQAVEGVNVQQLPADEDAQMLQQRHHQD